MMLWYIGEQRSTSRQLTSMPLRLRDISYHLNIPVVNRTKQRNRQDSIKFKRAIASELQRQSEFKNVRPKVAGETHLFPWSYSKLHGGSFEEALAEKNLLVELFSRLEGSK